MGRTLKCGWDEGRDMKAEIHYRWRLKSSAGKWFNNRHIATEESIRKQHPEATPVEGSCTEQIVLDLPAEMIAVMPNAQRPDLPVLIWPCTTPERDGRIPLKGLPDNYSVTQEGEEWVVMLNNEFLMYRGPGPGRIEATS